MPDETPPQGDPASPSELSPERVAELRELARRLDIGEVDLYTLNRALTHSSYLNEHGLPPVFGNERLEFLGDSVLGLVTTEYLYQTFPDDPEGALSKIKSVVVSARILTAVARDLSLGDHLLLGKGEEMSGGRRRSSILSACLEALIGAIYLSCGLDAARAFILGLLREEVDLAERGDTVLDHKSSLQEVAQRHRNMIPRYRVLEIAGPDHDRVFVVDVRLGNEVVGTGTGKSKKAAEQRAAQDALERAGTSWDLDAEPPVEG